MKEKIIILVVVVSIIATFISWLSGFPFTRTKIEQTVTIDDVCLNTYYVKTHLWIYRNGDVILDTFYRDSKTKCFDVQRIKKAQMEMVKTRLEVVKECLKDFKYCDNL